MFTTQFNSLSNGDAIAIPHMHYGMVCHHPINKQEYCAYFIHNASLTN